MYLNYLSLCLCFNYVRSINIFSVHLYKMNFKADLCKMTQSYLGHNILSGSWSTIISALLNGTMVFDGITGMMVGPWPNFPVGSRPNFPVGSHLIPVGSRPNFPVGSHSYPSGIPLGWGWDPDQISQWDWWDSTGI